ncbi:MAG: DUF559 domain-containing protein, partial [Acidobacteriota bacterium]
MYGAVSLSANVLRPYAQKLGKQLTDAEKCLWRRVRRGQLNGRQFYRQRIIGPYIVD